MCCNQNHRHIPSVLVFSIITWFWRTSYSWFCFEWLCQNILKRPNKWPPSSQTVLQPHYFMMIRELGIIFPVLAFCFVTSSCLFSTGRGRMSCTGSALTWTRWLRAARSHRLITFLSNSTERTKWWLCIRWWKSSREKGGITFQKLKDWKNWQNWQKEK